MDSNPAATNAERARLIDRARGGDVRAFESLYRELAPRVYGLCLRLAKNSAEAQDCTQDTFVRAWQKLGAFRGDSQIGTWLQRIAINEVLARRRRRSTEMRHLEAVHSAHSERYRAAGNPATLDDLERAIARLPDRARDVFVLRAVYGYTHEEIAGLLDVTVANSKTQYFRARRALAAALPGVPAGTSDAELGTTDSGAAEVTD